jgi:hypothetical protein
MKKKKLRRAAKSQKSARQHPAPKSKNAAVRRHKVRLAKGLAMQAQVAREIQVK